METTQHKLSALDAKPECENAMYTNTPKNIQCHKTRNKIKWIKKGLTQCPSIILLVFKLYTNKNVVPSINQNPVNKSNVHTSLNR